jgi:hypothetical protein
MAAINLEEYRKAGDMCEHEGAILQEVVKVNGFYKFFFYCPHGTCRHYQVEKPAERTPIFTKRIVAQKGGRVNRKDIKELAAYLCSSERCSPDSLLDEGL